MVLPIRRIRSLFEWALILSSPSWPIDIQYEHNHCDFGKTKNTIIPYVIFPSATHSCSRTKTKINIHIYIYIMCCIYVADQKLIKSHIEPYPNCLAHSHLNMNICMYVLEFFFSIFHNCQNILIERQGHYYASIKMRK